MNQADAQRVLTETIDYNSLICVGLAASLAPSAHLCPIRCPLFCCSARHLFALRVLTCLPPPLSCSSSPSIVGPQPVHCLQLSRLRVASSGHAGGDIRIG